MHYNDLLLDNATKLLLDSYLKQPQHGLLLHGHKGVGLGTIARTLAVALVAHPTDILTVEPDEKGTISIETVRTLYVSTRDKRTERQLVVIDDADAMSIDAQNAFLKLLEEPAKHTLFILTAHAPQRLLATITSRSISVPVRPITPTQSQLFLDKQHVDDPRTRQQLLFIAGSLPAELSRLVHDETYFQEQSSLVTSARELLQGSLQQRLVLISRFTERGSALRLLDTLSLLIMFSLARQTDESLLASSKFLETVAQRLRSNGHVRTQLLYLALHLP